MLKIDDSKQRKKDLQSWLGVPLTFEPNRRDDFDFIFMATRPAEGRELKPLLRFHDAGDIPVYAMGRIFSGKVAPASDQDLNGIVFPSTRWQLNSPDEATLALESVRGGALGNFYALGQDAWRLLPWLPLMQNDPDLWFPGYVGALRLQADGRLYRQPAWAQFSAGQPIPYQWPDNL
jgi:outer membrane PBP1 activator LpoA protein